MNGVWPIVIPQVDWKTFIREASRLTGKSPVSFLNDENTPVNQPASFLRTLQRFDSILFREHALFTFLMDLEGEEYLILLSKTNLNISVASRLGVLVVSGNIDQWEAAFVNLCEPKQVPGVIDIFRKLYVYFEQAELTQFFRFQKSELYMEASCPTPLLSQEHTK